MSEVEVVSKLIKLCDLLNNVFNHSQFLKLNTKPIDFKQLRYDFYIATGTGLANLTMTEGGWPHSDSIVMTVIALIRKRYGYDKLSDDEKVMFDADLFPIELIKI